ncbi:MAG: hypothetical protein V3U15_05380 [Nitrospinota bacterium]
MKQATKAKARESAAKKTKKTAKGCKKIKVYPHLELSDKDFETMKFANNLFSLFNHLVKIGAIKPEEWAKNAKKDRLKTQY